MLLGISAGGGVVINVPKVASPPKAGADVVGSVSALRPLSTVSLKVLVPLQDGGDVVGYVLPYVVVKVASPLEGEGDIIANDPKVASPTRSWR